LAVVRARIGPASVAVEATRDLVKSPSGGWFSPAEICARARLDAVSASIGPVLWLLRRNGGYEPIGGDGSPAAKDITSAVAIPGGSHGLRWSDILEATEDPDAIARCVIGGLRTLAAKVEERSSLRVRPCDSCTFSVSPDATPALIAAVRVVVRHLSGSHPAMIWKIQGPAAFAFVASRSSDGRRSDRWACDVERGPDRTSVCCRELDGTSLSLEVEAAPCDDGWRVVAHPDLTPAECALGAALWGSVARSAGLRVKDDTRWRPWCVASPDALDQTPPKPLEAIVVPRVATDGPRLHAAGDGDWSVASLSAPGKWGLERSKDERGIRSAWEIRVEARPPGVSEGPMVGSECLLATQLDSLGGQVVVSVYSGDSVSAGIFRVTEISGRQLASRPFELLGSHWVSALADKGAIECVPFLPDADAERIILPLFPPPIRSDWEAGRTPAVLPLTRATTLLAPLDAGQVVVCVALSPEVSRPLVKCDTGLLVSRRTVRCGLGWAVTSFVVAPKVASRVAGKAVNLLEQSMIVRWVVTAKGVEVSGEVQFIDHAYGLEASLQWREERERAMAPLGGYWGEGKDVVDAGDVALGPSGAWMHLSGRYVVVPCFDGDIRVRNRAAHDVAVRVDVGDGLRSPGIEPFILPPSSGFEGAGSVPVQRRFGRNGDLLVQRSSPRAWFDLVVLSREPGQAALPWRIEATPDSAPDVLEDLTLCINTSSESPLSIGTFGMVSIPVAFVGSDGAQVKVTLGQSDRAIDGRLVATGDHVGSLMLHCSGGDFARWLGEDLRAAACTLMVGGDRVPSVQFDLDLRFDGIVFAAPGAAIELEAGRACVVQVVIAGASDGVAAGGFRVEWRPAVTRIGAWKVSLLLGEPPAGSTIVKMPVDQRLVDRNPGRAFRATLLFTPVDMDGLESFEDDGRLHLFGSAADGGRELDSIQLRVLTVPTSPRVECSRLKRQGGELFAAYRLSVTLSNPMHDRAMHIEDVLVQVELRGVFGSTRRLSSRPRTWKPHELPPGSSFTCDFEVNDAGRPWLTLGNLLPLTTRAIIGCRLRPTDPDASASCVRCPDVTLETPGPVGAARQFERHVRRLVSRWLRRFRR
jgi:hypothetical protein